MASDDKLILFSVGMACIILKIFVRDVLDISWFSVVYIRLAFPILHESLSQYSIVFKGFL